MFGCRYAGDRSDVTLSFEGAQVIQPFSREESHNTDDTYDTDDTDDTYNTDDTDEPMIQIADDTDDAYDTDNKVDKDDTADNESTKSTRST